MDWKKSWAESWAEIVGLRWTVTGMTHSRGLDGSVSQITEIRHIVFNPDLKSSSKKVHLDAYNWIILHWLQNTRAPLPAAVPTIHLPTYPIIHQSDHRPEGLYHCSQLKSSPPPNTTKKPRIVRKMTAFPVMTRPQAPHWIWKRTNIESVTFYVAEIYSQMARHPTNCMTAHK